MARFSPSKVNFNGGEVSDLIIQRTDLDRFASFNRALTNYVSAPQGPVVPRSGTAYQHDSYKKDKYSALVPFIFSDEQANLLEFSDLRMRILSDDGVLTTGFVSITSVVSTTPFKFTSAALVAAGAAIGKQIAFAGFASARNLEGVIANVTAVSGNDITVDVNYNGATGAVTGTGGLVYEITTPYAHGDVRKLNYVQSLDIVYLFCEGYKQRKLSRLGETNWTLEEFDFLDGPYLDEVLDGYFLTPSATGKATEVHTTQIGTNGTTSSSGDSGVGNASWKAFDQDLDTYWESSTNQNGHLTYVFGTAQSIDGYTIYGPRKNDNSSLGAKGYRPTSWTFEVSVDGATNWIVVDQQYDYSLWKNFRTQYIKLNLGSATYKGFRVQVDALESPGGQNPRISELVLRKKPAPTLTLTLSSAAAINRGQGFLETDVGRLIRAYQTDGFWRVLKITARASSTSVTAELQGDPLVDTNQIRRWRMGLFSDTTGWPTNGVFHLDRLCVSGAFDNPTAVAMSAPQEYNNMQPTDLDGSQVADNGLLLRPATRNASPARWMQSTDRGLMVGYGSSVWMIGPSSPQNAFSATNAKAGEMAARGSAKIRPIGVDNDLLFVQQNKRTVRQISYSLEADTFKAQSVSLFASHMGKNQFEQIAYAAEPFSIAWLRTATGELKGLTYNRDENIIGWHKHDLAGGIVESIATIPSGTHDLLWAVVKRTVNSVERRYIEKLMPFWDFGDTIDGMHYVDCGVRVTSVTDMNTIYNASHLEGKDIHGVADSIYFQATVTNGKFDLPNPAKNVVYGLPYTMEGETANIEGGSQDGTAQGKLKRMHNVSLYLIESYGGKIGVYNEDTDSHDYDTIEGEVHYKAESDMGTPILWTGFVGPFNPPQGFGKRGAIAFKQELPYPFIIGGLYPQMNVEDRG